MPDTNRTQRVARVVALLALVVALVVAGRMLPVGDWVDGLEGWIADHGALGMAGFVGAYVAAALLFLPGSALTLVAGAAFGLWSGFALVSLASTLAAAAAFLVARTFARERVRRLAARYRRFDAIDRAVSEGGWKVVALLRLSPAIPYSASNYLYGLTGVRFGPYVLASWVFMLPGTFLYVYLGYAGREGLAGERTPGEWALLGVGLAATVAVTVYLTKLARRALAERSGLETREAT